MRFPDFIGVGSPRCGTTWFSHVLDQHPQIYLDPQFKEIHYFDNNYHRGHAWYARFFEDAEPDQVAGEFTPAYMVDEGNLDHIADAVPDAKLVLIIRDPVKRAFSHYMQRKRYQRQMPNFQTIIESNEKRILDFGLYGEQLQAIYARFPEKQVFVIHFEELVAKPEPILEMLQKFLEIEVLPLDPARAPKNAMTGVRSLALKQFMRGIRSLGRRHSSFERIFFKLLPGKQFLGWLRQINQKPLLQVDERMTEQELTLLKEFYAKDRETLEELLGRRMEWSW